jgi:hypothetical protein
MKGKTIIKLSLFSMSVINGKKGWMSPNSHFYPKEVLEKSIQNKENSMIKCLVFDNTNCLKCGKVEDQMVKIGAFVMCHEDWLVEFGVDEIDLDSELGKKYYKWLKVHKKKILEKG